MFSVTPKRVILQNAMRISSRAFSASQNTVQSNQPSINTDVPGLSENCVKVPNTPVGPNASKDKEYKNPEYFCYHTDSFAEAEVEMEKYRLPAPSNKIPFKK